MSKEPSRCKWAQSADDYIAYHDNEWGLPVSDDVRLFEKICLEGFQSGLSWLTILRKREGFRKAFAKFDFRKVAKFGPEDVERLVVDAAIIRHRGKIESTINNAQRAVELQAECGSLAAFLWRYEPKEPPKSFELRATSPESVALSKELKKRGWSFVGPTTMYAFMQSVGMVNDHADDCFARKLSAKARKAFQSPAS